MKGVLERIEDNRIAVILIEEEGREIHLPVTELPEGSEVNTWFDVDMKEGERISIRIDPVVTEDKNRSAQEILKKIKSKKHKSKFRRR
ncbi:MAG TPA: DUF3006 family protein [Planococcus sp. (in: firmicutes)]|nr:DUF3006 family protein [Planococcus sp. (in: firmicutes)]